MPGSKGSGCRSGLAASLCIVAVSLSVPARAASDADYARVNAALSVQLVVPGYRKLVIAASGFERSVDAACRSAPLRDLKAAKAAFHGAMDAWMGIEPVQFGPVGQSMRKFRIEYWPDKGARGARQLRQLLSRKDTSVLEPDRFRGLSVAVQGFPTAERLLFTEPTADALIHGTDGDFPCRLLAAIAANIGEMASRIVAGWTTGMKPFIDELRHPGGAGALYESHRAVTAEFVKALYTELEVIYDQKLARVIGKSVQDAIPHRAESWRSGRSLRNIVRNLETLQALYEGAGGPGLRSLMAPADAETGALLSKAFDQSLATARAIRGSLAHAATDSTQRDDIEKLALEVRALKQLIRLELAPALGTPLGFNALDGD